MLVLVEIVKVDVSVPLPEWLTEGGLNADTVTPVGGVPFQANENVTVLGLGGELPLKLAVTVYCGLAAVLYVTVTLCALTWRLLKFASVNSTSACICDCARP